MKSETRRRKKEKADPFAHFKQSAREAFEFLLRDYGFEQVSVSMCSPECTLLFRNRTTGVSVTHVFGGPVWVSLMEPGGAADGTPGTKSYRLDALVAELCPEMMAAVDWSERDLEKSLRAQAALLRECGSEILSGDFSIFPALRKRAAAFRRERNKELFGTYSGGSPRFSGRPTLAEVFADAKKVDPTLAEIFGDALNQDKTSHYVYEAYWDHAYTVAEIAEFLNMEDAAVVRMLEEQDDLG